MQTNFDHPFTRQEARSTVKSAFRGPSFDPPNDVEYAANGYHHTTSNAPGYQPKTFRLLTDEEAEHMPPVVGILGDVLFEDSIAFLYGRSGRWKTFVALGMALSIASNRPWLGRAVKPGATIYVTAEGARGIGKRIRAWKRHHGVAQATLLRVLPEAVHLLRADHVDALVTGVRDALGAQAPVLIVVDTLARAMVGGHENDTKDATNLMDAADRIRRTFPGCCVLFIHHTGYDETHMRGNTVFFAGADTVINALGAERQPLLHPGDVLRLVCEKPKDAEPFKTIALTATLEEWPEAESGQTVGSLVMVSSDPAPERADIYLGRNTQRTYDIFAMLVRDRPQGVTFTEWAKMAMTLVEIGKTTFKRYVNDLERDGYVWHDEETKHYRLPRDRCEEAEVEAEKEGLPTTQ